MKVFVDPLEVIGRDQGAANPDVGKDFAAGVEHECVHARRHGGLDFLFHDLAVACGGEVISPRPTVRIGFWPDVVQPLLERLESGVLVSVIVVADLVEIVPARVHG